MLFVFAIALLLQDSTNPPAGPAGVSSCAELLRLTREEASKGRNMTITGIVTMVFEPDPGSFVVQDVSGAAYVATSTGVKLGYTDKSLIEDFHIRVGD